MGRGWGSERASPDERGPIEGPLRWKAETDRVREGISEGCRTAEPERVAPGGAGTAEPQPRADETSQLTPHVGASRFSSSRHRGSTPSPGSPLVG